jgi:hypothetical protein
MVYFQTKSTNSLIGRCWYILWPFGIFCGHLVLCTKKNLATLPRTRWGMLFRKKRTCSILSQELGKNVSNLATQKQLGFAPPLFLRPTVKPFYNVHICTTYLYHLLLVSKVTCMFRLTKMRLSLLMLNYIVEKVTLILGYLWKLKICPKWTIAQNKQSPKINNCPK